MAPRPDLAPGVALAAAPVALGAGGRPDVSVVSSGHDVADARLHREVAAARAAGLSVEVLGLGSAGDGPCGADLRTGRVPAVSPRGWRWRSRSPGAPAAACCSPSTRTSSPPPWLVARLRRRRLVVDLHEDYVALLRGPRLGSRGASVGCAGRRPGRARRGPAGRPASSSPTSTCRRRRQGARPRLVVRNAPVVVYLPRRRPARSASPRPVHRRRAPLPRPARCSPLVEGAPGWALDVIGPVAGRRPGLAGRWRRLACRRPGSASTGGSRRCRPGSWPAAPGSGCSMLDDTPAFRDAVPSKLYEYLAAGLAVATTPCRAPRRSSRTSGGGRGRAGRRGAVGDAAGLGASPRACCRAARRRRRGRGRRSPGRPATTCSPAGCAAEPECSGGRTVGPSERTRWRR